MVMLDFKQNKRLKTHTLSKFKNVKLKKCKY